MRNKEQAEREVEDKRRVNLMKQVKWEEFRKRKHAIVIRYARVKKRQWRNIVWLQMMIKLKCLKKANWNIHATREYRSWSVQRSAFVMRILVRGIRRLRKYGGVKAIHQQQLRYVFSSISLTMGPEHLRKVYEPDRTNIVTGELKKGRYLHSLPCGGIIERAKQVLKSHLIMRTVKAQFTKRVVRTFEVVNYISDRIKNRNVFLRGKGGMYDILWHKVLDEFRETAIKLDHKAAIRVAEAIEMIPKSIKYYVIKEFIRRVQLINGISWFAYRMKNHPEACDDLECKMQILNLQRHLKMGLDPQDWNDVKLDPLAFELTDEDRQLFSFYVPTEQLKR